MKRKYYAWLGLALALALPLFLRVTTPYVQIVRGKSPAVPLTDVLNEAQMLAQDLALSDAQVQAYTVGRRSEVFGVRQVGQHYNADSAACAAAECWQVEIYNFDENAAVVSIVDVDHRAVLSVYYQPGVHPGINKRLADLALNIALNHPDVVNTLGYRPTSVDMAPVDAGFRDSVCDQGHLCVAPTIDLGQRTMWMVVDLTTEELVTIDFTQTEPGVPAAAPPPQSFADCTDAGSVSRDGWVVNYNTTGTDGFRVYDVTYNGVLVLTSAKNVEWHAAYSPTFGYEDYTGCGGGGGGFPISPYGPTIIQDITRNDIVIGFELIRDFRMFSWGNSCNYRYEQHMRFYDDGRFEIIGGAFGKGCGTDAVYRPIMRIDIAVAGDSGDAFDRWDGAAWTRETTETYRTFYEDNGPHLFNGQGYSYRITDRDTGFGYYATVDRGEWDHSISDWSSLQGLGPVANIYAVQHHPDEGDTDLGIIGDCCGSDYEHGPHIYLNGENIQEENIVLWYVPQMRTDAVDNGDGYFCWTLGSAGNITATYPCFGGVTFTPIAPLSQRSFLPSVLVE